MLDDGCLASTIQVACAHSGLTYTFDFTVAQMQDNGPEILKRRFAKATGSDYQHQIFLVGPPWRLLDHQDSLHLVEGQSFFVYDKNVIRQAGNIELSHATSTAVPSVLAARLAGCEEPPRDSAIPRSITEACSRGLLTQSCNDACGQQSIAGPLQRALRGFVDQFRLRLAQGRTFASVAQARARFCEFSANRQATRSRAMKAAVANMVDHHRKLRAAHSIIAAKAECDGLQQREALERFEEDLERLTHINLHASIANALSANLGSKGSVEMSRQLADCPFHSLADCVNAQRVRRWAETCARSLAAFESHAARISSLVDDAAAEVVAVEESSEFMGCRPGDATSVTLEGLRADAAVCTAVAASQQAVLGELEADVRLAVQLVAQFWPGALDVCATKSESIVSGEMSCSTDKRVDEGGDSYRLNEALKDDAPTRMPTAGSKQALEVCRELQQFWDARIECIEEMKSRDCLMAACVRRSHRASRVSTQRSIVVLHAVARSQSRVFRIRSRHLEAHAECLKEKAAAFSQLDAVRRLPETHAALCIEIAKRRSYGQVVKARVQTILDEIAALRDAESARRDHFARTHGIRLPRSLLQVIPGLADRRVSNPNLEAECNDADLPSVRRESCRVSYRSAQGLESVSALWLRFDDVDLFPSRETLGCDGSSDVQHFRDSAKRAHGDARTTFSSGDSDIGINPIERLPRRVLGDDRVTVAAAPLGSRDEFADACSTRRYLFADFCEAVRGSRTRARVSLRTSLEADPFVLNPFQHRCSHLEPTNLVPKISFCRLDVGSSILFIRATVPGMAGNVYLAFHHGCPHRYMAPECVNVIQQTHHFLPDFVIGRVCRFNRFVAHNGNNRYGLSLGSTVPTTHSEHPFDVALQHLDKLGCKLIV
mmetsp:Transcript_3411/g.10542  ORF Transcript_3411/g.10542 Transcript_3411/m.10542 type:complete len:888 (-) Transcript_3411:35-2698(-)